jgi:thymidine kinase
MTVENNLNRPNVRLYGVACKFCFWPTLQQGFRGEPFRKAEAAYSQDMGELEGFEKLSTICCGKIAGHDYILSTKGTKKNNAS